MWFIVNNIDSHPIKWELVIFINVRVLRLGSADWRSSLRLILFSMENELFTEFASGLLMTFYGVNVG